MDTGLILPIFGNHQRNMKKKKDPSSDESREDRINRVLAHMKHRDLQRACILKGLEFKLIVEYDHHKLANWYYKNFGEPEDLHHLEEYDIWVENVLQEQGYKKGDAVLAPAFRFGFSPEVNGMKGIQTPGAATPPMKSEVEDKPKTKRVVDESTGVYSGTKKNLTYTLTNEGLGIEEILKRVLEKFPEAQDKSIKIWHKRRLKAIKDGKDEED